MLACDGFCERRQILLRRYHCAAVTQQFLVLSPEIIPYADDMGRFSRILAWSKESPPWCSELSMILPSFFE